MLHTAECVCEPPLSQTDWFWSVSSSPAARNKDIFARAAATAANHICGWRFSLELIINHVRSVSIVLLGNYCFNEKKHSLLMQS
jgi:hypothetical protein